jgi:ubiquinone/menaquinone biosynthesis C-methylase UbiE
MADGHVGFAEDEAIMAEMQSVRLTGVDLGVGWLLDIGGGGEGIIGLAAGSRVVSIDLRREELAGVSNEALKLTMDAREMAFLDGSFPTVASFFTFMYIEAADHAKVLGEVFRVLRPGGRLLAWDVNLPATPGPGKRVFVLPLVIELPDGRTAPTMYGAGLKELNLASLTAAAEAVGFRVARSEESGATFFLELVKP